MLEAWEVMGAALLISALVAFGVSFLIAVLVLLIQRFSRRPAVPAAEPEVDETEIAVAIAVALRQR